jgi:meso-butanediol dehydrogenase/(S,S)-butanediol dehydrogenase/diacetyl reductase
MRFEGKAIIVTGAASGLGRATAQRFCDEGAQVLGIDLNEAGLAETGQLCGDRFVAHVANLGGRASCAATVDAALEAFGHLDVLANVAGVLRSNHVVDVTEDEYALIMNVNVGATFWMCQAALPHLIETRGNIVNVASNAGIQGTAYNVVYAASKAAVINMTRAMAMEFARRPIRVNAVAPGAINTPLFHTASFPEDVNWRLIQPYMGYRDASEPEAIAAVIAFVASEDASAIHGAVVSADEGMTAC